jgi:hypothetical protein
MHRPAKGPDACTFSGHREALSGPSPVCGRSWDRTAGTTLLPYSEVVESQHMVRNSAPVSRKSCDRPAAFIGLKRFSHKNLWNVKMDAGEKERELKRQVLRDLDHKQDAALAISAAALLSAAERTLLSSAMPSSAISTPNSARSVSSSRSSDIDELAEWIAAEVKKRGILDHHEAANTILQRRGGLCLIPFRLVIQARERNDLDGSVREVYRFSAPVLEAFRKMSGKTVRWGKEDRYWVAVKPKARSA